MRELKVLVVGAAASLLCTLLLLSTAYARAAEPTPQPFDIQPQGLAAALNAFARQSHEQILFTPDVVARKFSSGVHGNMPPLAALQILLKDSGLAYASTPNGAILVGASGSSLSQSVSGGAADISQKEGKSNSSDGFRMAQADQGANPQSSAVEGSRTSSQDSSNAGQLQEVIVTAQKRYENLMDVPSSLSVLSAAALQNQGVTDFNDYMTLVPSLSNFSAGAEGHGAIILRGLNTGYFQFSNTVGYYLDDTPFSATSPLAYGTFITIDPDLTDIDHLEVLKGPQATLYGASTLGGLIKVVTKQPDLSSNSGQVRLDGSTIDGGASGYGMVGIANVVLIPGELALRVSGFDRETPGYMTNVTLDNKDRNVTRKEGGRISLAWSPTENLDIRVSAFLQSLFVDGWTYEDVSLQTLQPVTGPYTYSE